MQLLLLTLVIGLCVFSLVMLYLCRYEPRNYNGINCWQLFGYPNAGAVHRSTAGHVREAHPSASMWRSNMTIRINNLKP